MDTKPDEDPGSKQLGEQPVGDFRDVEQGGGADATTIERVYRYVSPCVDAAASHQAPSPGKCQSKNKDSNFNRKLDLRIIPAFWTLYFLCSAIRSNIGLAQTMNIEQHHDLGHVLHMTPHQISTGLALFYVCYVIFDFPSNLIMSRLSPRAWMSRIVIAVGIIGSCFAAARAAWSI
jgi:sugar phosphate permease